MQTEIITNKELGSGVRNFSALYREKITISTKDRINNILDALEPKYNILVPLEAELFKKHGAEEQEGGILYIPPEKETKEFKVEWAELLSLTHTISFEPIDYTKIANVESDQVNDIKLIKRFCVNVE